MVKQLYESKNMCCGCSACYAVCPVNAISMIADDEGFKYPQVDPKLCVGCKKCELVCPLKSTRDQQQPLAIYAAKNKNESIRKNSSSGGMFPLLANYVEAQDGVIYGAAFDEQCKVTHMRAEAPKEWKKLCGSKYVQSDMNDVFTSVKNDLCNDRTVLFSGTPCQIDGLIHYIKAAKVSPEKLITCDIVCHGTPSPKVWDDYLKFLLNRTKKDIGFISFRDKHQSGWHNSTITIRNHTGEVIFSESQQQNYFFQLFLCHLIIRPSCHECKYANFHRPGDITLGDFWGIEENFAHFDDNKGVSLVIINSQKGARIWNDLQNSTDHLVVSQNQCTQPNLVAPSKKNRSRGSFWRWYRKYGIKIAGQRMGYVSKNILGQFTILCLRCWEKLISLTSANRKCKDD